MRTDWERGGTGRRSGLLSYRMGDRCCQKRDSEGSGGGRGVQGRAQAGPPHFPRVGEALGAHPKPARSKANTRVPGHRRASIGPRFLQEKTPPPNPWRRRTPTPAPAPEDAPADAASRGSADTPEEPAETPADTDHSLKCTERPSIWANWESASASLLGGTSCSPVSRRASSTS